MQRVPFSLTPVALRAVTWHKARPQAFEPSMAQAGEVLFKHDWTVNDPLANGGDGLGPVFNATSCVACHDQGGVGGSGGLKHNVTVFTVRLDAGGGKPREGVIHARAKDDRFRETLTLVDASLPRYRESASNRYVGWPVGYSRSHRIWCWPVFSDPCSAAT